MAESPLAILVVDDEENHAVHKDNQIAASLEKPGVVCQVAYYLVVHKLGIEG